MKARQLILLAVGLALIAGGAGLLLRLKAIQRLGEPGVKVSPIPGTDRLRIDLPERVPLYESTNVEPARVELEMLPEDTTFGRRVYRASDGFQIMVSAVMMGSDRTSIHKPEFCLTAQGWRIDRQEKGVLPIYRPHRYDLPVQRYTATAEIEDPSGRRVPWSGVYVFWFVADNKLTASHWVRVGWITRELLRRGVLPRWAYISCFSACQPGQEEATFRRMRQFLTASVPEFQTTVPPPMVEGGAEP